MVSKVQERIFAEEAANLLGVNWGIVDIPEPPDFEVNIDNKTYGLEIRQVFLGSEAAHGSPRKRAEANRSQTLRSIAQSYYRAGGKPAHVKVLGELQHAHKDALVAKLIEARPEFVGPETPINTFEFSGAKYFVKALPSRFANYSNWIAIDSHTGWPTEVAVDDLQRAVGEKARRLDSYKSKYSEMILLLVADRAFESGMLIDSGQFLLSNPGFSAIFFMSRFESIRKVG